MKEYENRTVTIPIFNYEYKVVVCWGDSRYIERILKREGMQNVGTASALSGLRGATFFADKCNPVIAIPRHPETPTEMGTLAHEACHAVEHIFNQIGQKLGDEVFAHAVGAVVRHTLKVKKNVQQDSNKDSSQGKRKTKSGATPKGKTAGRASR